MLRLSWRPDGPRVLEVDGVVDLDHADVLTAAATAAAKSSERLHLDLTRAQLDNWGRQALKTMERNLWTTRRVTVTADPMHLDGGASLDGTEPAPWVPKRVELDASPIDAFS